ncbi:MAG: WD40 repeat [Candidatus Electronema aureum]|uniref:WD40 repeat n=1 Tax=Candidatus Electronema aureum TaxID=2005002 RepID=A0A521G5L7_9BACT|nr:MAG: WD40 repeat [Candidatus Electronema aureum]
MSSPSLEFALVRILINDQSPRKPVGAGFLVTPRHLLTCAHVINDALGRKQNAAEQPDLPVFLDFPLLPGQPLLQAKILHWFPLRDDSTVGELEDIAVLELPADAVLPAGVQPAPFEVLDNKASFLDDAVRMCGFPAGVDDGTYANGRLQGRNAKGWVEIHHQDSNIVEQGFSGTAVWAVKENAVCGMTVSMLSKRDATIAYMIPALTLLKALPAIDAFNRSFNPYRGLEAFREKDARFYFGRQEAVELIRQAALRQSFTAVIGASGSGKSSAVFAGLVPLLKASKTDRWLCAACRPKSQPFDELAACLIPFLYDDALEQIKKAKDCAADLAAGKLSLPDLLRPVLGRNSGAKLLLIVDQFEELFTLNPDKALVRRYIEELLAARQAEGCAALITMRADFLGTAIAYDLFAEALNNCPPIMLPPMGGQGLREAVEQPAALLHVSFEPGLADLIAEDVGSEPGSLPLLEFCLTQLWEKQERRQISHAAYKASGGVQGALAGHADKVLKEFDEQQVRQIFLKLVRPGQGTEDTRQVAALEQFSPEQCGLIQKLADKDRRLLVTSGDADGKEKNVEVVHEALIRCWRTLRQWVDKEREFLVWREKLKMLLKQWQESGHDEGALLRGLPLAEAAQWRESHAGYLAGAKDELEFIAASEQLRESEWLAREAAKEEKERQRKRSMIALAAGLMIAIALSVFAVAQWQKTAQQTIAANYNLAKAFEKEGLRSLERADKEGTDAYKKALLFGYAAFEQKIDPRKSALDQSSVDLLFAPEIFNAALAELTIFGGHENFINSAVFSPDDTRIASASYDKTARIWDIETGRELKVLKGHNETINSVAFSPDGRRIASASHDKTVRIWDVATGKELTVLKGHEEAVNSVAFSPDGRQIASASEDKTVRIWDAITGKELTVFKGHEKLLFSVAFSPDGKRIASASEDKTVRIWDAITGKELAVLKGHEEAVNSVAFSPDGRQIASASWDKTVRIWDAITGKESAVLKGHEDLVISAAFNPDGRRIASASHDKTVRIWDAETGKEIAVFHHDEAVRSAAFSRDGKRIASASYDKTVRIWDAETGSDRYLLKGHEYAVYSASFSSNGRWIVSASYDKTVRIWNAETGRNLAVLRGHESVVRSATFSPDGKWIASASEDKTVRIWGLPTGKVLAVLKGHEDHVTSVAFSPDSKRIASASDDKTVRIWNAATGKVLTVLKGHEKTIYSATFSPDGRRIASASEDKTVRIWDAATGKVMAVFKGHEGRVNSAAFSPDGRRIASASEDKTVRIWDAATGKVMAVFKGHESYVNSAAFSPDGKRIASASYDKTVRIWDIKSGKLLAVLNGHEKPVSSTSFNPDGTRVASASRDNTVRIWDLKLCTLFLQNFDKPTPFYFTFMEAVKFLWQVKLDGLEFVSTDRRTAADMEKFGSLLAPPPPGQSKFDQVLEWAEKQQPK